MFSELNLCLLYCVCMVNILNFQTVSNKLLDIRAGINKMLVRIAEKTMLMIRLIVQKQSELSVPCLAGSVWNLRIFEP